MTQKRKTTARAPWFFDCWSARPVTYSSAASEPAFDFDTPLSCWLARIVVSDIADWASSGTDEAVSLSFEGCESSPSDVRRATTAESPMTSDGFVFDEEARLRGASQAPSQRLQ